MSVSIMFYNLENLYDTINDPNKNDNTFTPLGSHRWDEIKYYQKLDNLAQVINATSSLPGGFPAIVGVSEIENDKVLSDLCNRKLIKTARYQFVHYESNDARGVDVALLFRPDRFKLIGSEPIKLILRSGREYIGRDILCVWGELEGEMFCIYVCHFISRRGGTESSAGFRRAGAETTYNHIQMMKNQFPGIKVVVMGDMNDEPDDDSMSILLHGRKMISEVGEDDLFNPMWQLMIQGRGSSMHNHRWMMFDNILISHNLLPDYSPYPDHKLHLVKSDKRNFAMIFAKKFMLLRGRPKRSYEGSTFCGGYSDHLPIIITLRKS